MTLPTWQRTNILTAMHYLKEIARTGKDARAGSLAQGLAEVLEPSRRAAQAAPAVAGAGRERRMPADRRRTTNRRQNPLPFGASDRRVGVDRRVKGRRGPS